MDRALASWDSVHEWADYISFLGRLSKAFKQHASNYETVPSSQLVARRLSQCLEPNLPSGVHQKTLEVYDMILKAVQAQLASQLSLWLPGILPLMSYASFNVTPLLIDLVQSHVLTLTALPKHVIKSMLLAFLPGIEDETSESFDQVLKLLDDIKVKLNDDAHFWQCFFLVVISSPSKRSGALVWANRRLPSFSTGKLQLDDTEDEQDRKAAARKRLNYEALMAVSPDPGLLIRAFCKALQDDQILVQRGFLELLLRNLELQSACLQVLSDPQDLKLLLLSVCSTVLRRDMSLNRRLWNWLLGPDPEMIAGARSRWSYFAEYALSPLCAGLLEMLDSIEPGISVSQATKPFRIGLSILDRWEVGSQVIPQVLVPSIRTVKRLSDSGYEHYEEVLRSASAFIDGVEPINIWHDVLELLADKSSADSLELVSFIVDTFNMRDEEMVVTHLPLIFLVLLSTYSSTPHFDVWYRITKSVFDLIPDRAFLPTEHSASDGIDSKSVIDSIYRAYSQQPEEFKSPYPPADISDISLSQLTALTVQSMSSQSIHASKLINLLGDLISKIPHADQLQHSDLVQASINLKINTEEPDTSNVGLIEALAKLFDLMASVPPSDAARLLNRICELTWQYLKLTDGDNHVVLVRSLWFLHQKADDDSVESSLSSLIVSDNSPANEIMHAFSGLWLHSMDGPNYEAIITRPLFLILDKLAGPDLNWKLAVKQWLDSTVAHRSAFKVLQSVVQPLLESTFFTRGEVDDENDDLDTFTYFASTLHRLLSVNSDIRNLYFRADEDQRHVIEQLVTEALLQFLKFRTTNAAANGVCIDILESTLTDSNLQKVTDAILDLVQFNNGTAQVRLLSLLSQCLTRSNAKVPTKLFVQRFTNGLLSETNSLMVTQSWIELLRTVFPRLGSAILQIMIPLTKAYINKLTQSFNNVKDGVDSDLNEFLAAVDGAESLLVFSHERLKYEEANSSQLSINTHEPPSGDQSGFFGNVISGVFTVESPLSRSSSANDRLTVILCFQDLLKMCYSVWKWLSPRVASASYMQSRLKSRVRRVMIRLYNLETMEMLECLVTLGKSSASEKDHGKSADGSGSVLRLVTVLDGSRPNVTLPHLFKSVMSRVNPGPMESADRSSLSTEVADSDIVAFLVEYLRSIDNDAIEEVWSECMAFARECQTNQSLYRHLMPSVLTLLSLMGQKVDVVRFGEQKRVRKELGDVFARLLTYSLESSRGKQQLASSLKSIVPTLRSILVENDRVQMCVGNMVSMLIVPLSRSKQFPNNVTDDVVGFIRAIVELPQTQKAWKSFLGDLVLDSNKLLSLSNPDLVEKWLPILRRWVQVDKDRVKDFISRLSGTSNAVNLFGSNSDEEKISSINKLSLLLLCGDDFMFLDLRDLASKLEEVLSPGTQSSVLTCLRAVIFGLDQQALAPIWTLVYNQLTRVFEDSLQNKPDDSSTIISACKLLDLLLCIEPEDFKMHEWLFICDSMDAVFRDDAATGLIDRLSATDFIPATEKVLDLEGPLRAPLLDKQVKTLKDVKPFIDRLSILAYEGTYSLKEVDLAACKRTIIEDLIN